MLVDYLVVFMLLRSRFTMAALGSAVDSLGPFVDGERT